MSAHRFNGQEVPSLASIENRLDCIEEALRNLEKNLFPPFVVSNAGPVEIQDDIDPYEGEQVDCKWDDYPSTDNRIGEQ